MAIQDYIGYPLVAWNDYNRNPLYLDKNTRCYIAPKASDKSGLFEPINVERIEVELYQNVEPFYKVVGSLVEIRMFDAPSKNTNPYSSNPYFMWYSKGVNKTGIQIEQYKGEHLLQVVRMAIPIETITKTHSIPVPSTGLLTKRVLLELNGTYYGPFDAQKIDDKTLRLNARKEDKFYVAKHPVEFVEPFLIPMTDNYGSLDLMDSRRLSPVNADNRVDFFSDLEMRELFVTSLDIKSREQIEKLRTFYNIIDNEIISADREQRISQILRNVEHQDATLRQIAYYVLATKDLCENVMDRIVKERLDMVLQRIPEGKFNLPEHETAETAGPGDAADPTAVMPLNVPLTGISGNISFSDSPSVTPATEMQAAERKAALLKLQTKYEKTLEKLELADDLETLRKESKRLKREIDTMNKAAEVSQEKLDTIHSEVQKEAQFLTKAIDKSFFDLVLKAVGDKDIAETHLPPFNVSLLSKETRPQRIIDRMMDIMEQANRILPGDEQDSRNEIANYLICLVQGFITTFAGEPGTGKTSLCQLLARALGLVREDDNKRFVEVSVERGWTSHKDFIGYYNPLSKSMEISNREVFNALILLDREAEKKPEEAAPFLILLDEANLSPLEHYWAAFLRICDFDSASMRTVNMGGQSIFTIPNHLRFAATVNFDHTTEELSPRFIDRSWIITLQPEMINTNPAAFREYEEGKVISFEALQRAFLPRNQKIDETILEEWNSIQSIFSSNKLPIYPRNLKMVQNYFQAAYPCMDTSREENRFAPLDYAVAQKVLPTINGTGERYGNLIDALLTQCNGKMPLCYRHLMRIKDAAESNLGFYQFFSK
ncbi:MAG: hypothetical protein LBT89_08730 [Planctomycetaceae bacterium]|jgi:hypothetical protein|nr:hypothetical protein [Planctomycetaceae bacterium]